VCVFGFFFRFVHLDACIVVRLRYLYTCVQTVVIGVSKVH
jgi:hypothetical protein